MKKTTRCLLLYLSLALLISATSLFFIQAEQQSLRDPSTEQLVSTSVYE